jgi:hypothetical protein
MTLLTIGAAEATGFAKRGELGALPDRSSKGRGSLSEAEKVPKSEMPSVAEHHCLLAWANTDTALIFESRDQFSKYLIANEEICEYREGQAEKNNLKYLVHEWPSFYRQRTAQRLALTGKTVSIWI